MDVENAKQSITNWFDEDWKDSKTIKTEDPNTVLLEKFDPAEGRQLLIVEEVKAYRVSYVSTAEGDLVPSEL